MNDSIDTSEREAEEPRMLRLPVREMSAEPAPPPVAAGYEAHPVGTGDRLRRLDRVNAELVAEMRRFMPVLERLAEHPAWQELTAGLGIGTTNAYRAALTSATKE